MKFISKQGRLKATKSLLVSISARELKWWLLIQSRGYALKELITRGWAQYRWRIIIREGTFIGGGGGVGRGFGEEGKFSKFFTNWGVSNLFYSQLRGRVIVFLARKKLLHVTSILYIQAKLPVKINLNYLQVWKNLYTKNYLLPTNIIVSVDPCPLSPIFWCFRSGFGDLLLLKPRELPTGAFFQSRIETVAKAFLVGTSGPKGQVELWQNSIWEFSIFALWRFGNHPRSSSSHFSALALSLVPTADVPPTESEE